MIFGKKNSGTKYKYKNLEVYAWDRAFGKNKKYRKVYEKEELNYVSAELSFYNKEFAESDWKVKIDLVCFELDGEKSTELSKKTETVEISQEENIYHYSFGWGNDDKGSYWDKGIYEWKAYLDDEFVGSVKFYVEDMGLVEVDNNPYLTVLSLRTYEAPIGDCFKEDRVYLKSFNIDTARYIMGELRFVNKVPNDWYYELFFNIYDDTGLLVGKSTSLSLISPQSGVGDEFTDTAGWGTENPGSWLEDNYTMEVVFMDTVIAVIPFSIGKSEVNRLSDYEALLNEDVNSIFNDTVTIKKSNAEITSTSDTDDSKVADDSATEDKNSDSVEVLVDDMPIEEILAELDALIGLNGIKLKVREYIDYISFLQLREESGIKEDEEVILHSVFTGNPGTGKTTVVKLLGKIFKAMGLLSKGHVHVVEANDLISGFVRQSGGDTKKVIEEARGGILFIDEAYMLFKDGASSDFGPEAVAALITEMSDGVGDLAIMVAGYPKEMEAFLKSNPGLKSRFRNHFHFEDYTPDELIDISQFAANKKGVKISKGAALQLKKILTESFRKRDRTFGNARLVHSIIDEAKMNLGIRVMNDADIESLTKEQLSTLKDADIEDIANTSVLKKINIGIDTALLKEALAELNILTGLATIKQEVNELIKLSKYYKEINRDLLKAFSMHTVFMGNPGTGKTTVARIVAKIYKALGLLERGHLIDADASDLEGEYLGHTSIKTKELIKRAMGGILFIDEAYAITEGRNTDFGKKAIAALIKEMEDHRGEFGVIVAGYTKNMEDFLEANPGLKSRFDQSFHFQDFSEDELWTIAVAMYHGRGLYPSSEAETYLKVYIESLHKTRDQFFGNARSIRKMVEKSSRNQELRMAGLKKKMRTEKVMSILSIDDVKEFIPKKVKQIKKPAMGFKF